MRGWATFGLVAAILLTGCGERMVPSSSETITPLAAAASATLPSSGTPASVAPSAGHARLTEAADRSLPTVLRGVTTDSAWDVPALATAIRTHAAAPTVRIVLDPQPRPEAYRPAIEALRPHAFLMALLLDSTAMRGFTADEVAARAEAYLAAYGDRIDLWEIGNELNGAWVGASPEEIDAKVAAAFDVVAGRHGKRTAITLNYWSSANCYAKPWEATLPFAASMPERVRRGTDYVMLSIYETACRPAQHPSAAEVGDLLAALADLFPNAKLAIGETGAQGLDDGLPADATFARKKAIAGYYYGMDQALRGRLGARFVGGYFWWYYAEDAVPRRHRHSLWPTLDRLLSSLG